MPYRYRGDLPLLNIGKKLQAEFGFHSSPFTKIERAVHHECIRQKVKIAFAESCTGGAISAALVKIPKASSYLLGSIVAYSNEWKERFLGVSPQILQTYGAVSREAVGAMIDTLFKDTSADYAVAVSGILGPKGDSFEKPVGTVYIGVGKRGEAFDIGCVQAPEKRVLGIQWVVNTALFVLWRRLANHEL